MNSEEKNLTAYDAAVAANKKFKDGTLSEEDMLELLKIIAQLPEEDLKKFSDPQKKD